MQCAKCTCGREDSNHIQSQCGVLRRTRRKKNNKNKRLIAFYTFEIQIGIDSTQNIPLIFTLINTNIFDEIILERGAAIETLDFELCALFTSDLGLQNYMDVPFEILDTLVASIHFPVSTVSIRAESESRFEHCVGIKPNAWNGKREKSHID